MKATIQKREILGQWWLPGDPAAKWIGTLTLEPQKPPRLRVTVTEGYFHFQEWQDCPVLHGQDEHGKPVTLLFIGRPSTEGAAALSEIQFTAGYAVLGMELRHPDDLKIHYLNFGMQHLHEWIGASGIREERSAIDNFSITYSRPPNECFTIDDDLTIEIRTFSSGHRRTNERLIHEDTSMEIRSRAGLNLPRSKQILLAIRHFMHFAVLKPVYPLWIIGQKDGHGYTVQGSYIPLEVEIWSSVIRERVESEIEAERWLFRFSDVQPRFAAFFADWLKFCNDFEEALGCYMTAVHHRLPASVEHQCLAQDLEAYHGVRNGRQPFAKRIHELTLAHFVHFGGLLGDALTFAKEVRDNRNYYTHHDLKIKQGGRVRSGAGLIRLNEKIRLLFQMCVLAEMEIPADRFPRLRRQLATHITDIP